MGNWAIAVSGIFLCFLVGLIFLLRQKESYETHKIKAQTKVDKKNKNVSDLMLLPSKVRKLTFGNYLLGHRLET